MNADVTPSVAGRRRTVFAAAVATVMLGFALANSAVATTPAEELVEKSRFSVERMLADPEMQKLKSIVQQARGVVIIPELVKGGFIVGAEGGSGVFMARGADGSWSAPAFYTLAAGSFGLQIGGQVSEVVFVLMTDGAVEALLGNELKLGVDAGVAIGPLGMGLEASTTTNLGADIYAFSKSVGLFGGVAFEGAKLISRNSWNDAYYGAPAPARARASVFLPPSPWTPRAMRM